MKRFLTWALGLLALPIVLFLVLTFLLYLPPVQDFAVRQVASYVSRETGMDIQVERLRLTFPLDIDLQGLTALEHGDTLVAVRDVLVDLDLSQLLAWRVGIDAIRLDDVHVDTKEMIASLRLQTKVHQLTLRDDVDFAASRVSIASVVLDRADVDIALRDTVLPDDTTSTPLLWQIAVAKAEVRNTHVRVSMPGDSLCVATTLNSVVAETADLDLGEQTYDVLRAHIAADTVAYVQLRRDESPLVMSLGQMELAADTIHVTDESLRLGSTVLQTPTSRLHARVAMDYAAFAPGDDGHMSVQLESAFSRTDIASVAGGFLPADVLQAWPESSTSLRLAASGRLDSLALSHLEASLPGSFTMKSNGQLLHLITDSLRESDVTFDVRTSDMAWVRRMAGGLDGIALPPMSLAGSLRSRGSVYHVKALVQEGAGSVGLSGHIDTRGIMSYQADLSVRQLNLKHFIKADSLGLMTADVSLQGRGTDIFSPATCLDADFHTSQLSWGQYDLSGLGGSAHVVNGRGWVRLEAENPLLTMTAEVDARLSQRISDLVFSVDVASADLHRLGLVDHPFSTSMCLHVDGTTDLRSRHELQGSVTDIAILSGDSLFHPGDISMRTLLTPDSIHARVASGNLYVDADASVGYERALKQLGRFTDELKLQMKERRLDLARMRSCFPQVDLHVAAGGDNPLCDYLKTLGYSFEALNFDMQLDPLEGINGGALVYGFNTGNVLLDTVSTYVFQDSLGVNCNARVRNGYDNPQFTFDALLDVQLTNEGAEAQLTYTDERGRTGVRLGMEATVVDETFRIHLNPLDPVIAYRTFHLNEDNYFILRKRNRIDANINLLADDGTGVKVYTTPNDEALQDVSVSVNRLNLGELTSVIPYMPQLTGFLRGDAHLVLADDHLSVSTDMTVDDMTYQGAPLGQIGLQAVYLPNADGSHLIDGSLLQTGMPIATFGGTYSQRKDVGVMDLDVALERFPLNLGDGFIPDAVAHLSGLLMGDIHVGGTTEKLIVDGQVSTVDARVRSDVYSLDLRLSDDTLRVKNSDLRFNHFKVFSTGTSPFVVDGNVNFANLERVKVDVTMNAENFELINSAKVARQSKTLAYGRVYVDVNSTIRGTLNDLRMRGRLKVLGNTDVTYVLADTPLSVDDQLSDLVTFVDFSDTTYVDAASAASVQNLNMSMNVVIDEGAQVHCMLSRDGSSYVNLEGSGNLMMTYSPEKDLQLSGRYTVSAGTMKYTMAIIPLKEFTIKSGSYVEFRGPLMNPVLNLQATERVRTSVSENGQPRSVNFEVGMSITQTLENLGLEFTIEAIDDGGISNQLASMGADQRERIAVTMLATGMYISDITSSSNSAFSANNALNSFLQSQISSFTQQKLQGMDISLGIEDGMSSSGNKTTDYSFRFAKRFWGNRVSVMLGGKVSTGSTADNSGQLMIDNVSIEYRLDKSGTRSVSLFCNRNHESMLEGDVTEMGAGLVLRRKTKQLGELFVFKNKK